MEQTKRAIPSGYARIHYYRAARDFDNWALYSFDDTAEPTDNFNAGPTFPTGTDSFGAFFDIRLRPNPQELGFIVHNLATGAKDPGPDMHISVSQSTEAWVVSGDAAVHKTEPTPTQILAAGFSRLQAFWIDRTTIAIQSKYDDPGWRYTLLCSPDASLQITRSGTLKGATVRIRLKPYAPGLSTTQLSRYPQLAGYAILHLADTVPLSELKRVLKGQLAVAANQVSGALTYVTGVQSAGVLDDLLCYPGKLGLLFRSSGSKPSAAEHSSDGAVRICVWAPTAQWVRLLLYRNPSDNDPEIVLPMHENHGAWSVTGDCSWRGKYYLFDVRVYVPSLHAICDNRVTDPYSVDLALNGTKSRITDLEDPHTRPEGWKETPSPGLRDKNDLSIYELHVRDFSATDRSVPEQLRGTYLAFTDPRTNGMRHLTELAQAGLKAVHLLPTFHFSSVDEDKSSWQSPGDLSNYPADSGEQQARIVQVQEHDAYNWGYDPVHFLAPHGSYAFDPGQRVREYRAMVLGLHKAGLRVIQDQVFNHTTSHGQAAHSVLDKIVPGYYYRLDADGNVQNGSCCPDTASEHRMMEKLMIDVVLHSAREYKIDGFRFDLMGFHFVYNMQRIARALSQLALERDSVDGSKIYLYGEGWETGETAHDTLGPNASQMNMYGCGIGTFNDRMRDGVRGGSPFSEQRLQGFATGLLTDSSAFTNGAQAQADQWAALLLQTDWVKASLAGNLRDFSFVDSSGQRVKASQVSYNGQAAGYAESPIETVNFCSVHDNRTLFDAVQMKSASPVNGGGDTTQLRARRQVLAMSLIALAQGIPFFAAGDDLLRSKDMDENSFDSGDWFNRLDFSYRTNNWGIGLPLAKDNQADWHIMQPLLADPALRPAPDDIAYTRDAFRELLQIRESSPLFRMSTLEEVQANLSFMNHGPQQIPGLIVMKLNANGADFGAYRYILAVFNGTREAVHFQDKTLQNAGLKLHPVQASSSDAVVRSSTCEAVSGIVGVPGVTTAVFVSEATALPE